MEKFWAVITAIYKGRCLTDSATWKNRQVTINALLAVMGAGLVFMPPEMGMSGEQMESIAGGIATVAGLYNAWSTTATSDKVGLPTKSKNK
jgi:hypothetical protein